jgi:hypothetical protein
LDLKGDDMHQEGRVISTTNSGGLPGSQLPNTPTVVEHDHRVDRIKVLTFDARKGEQYELILMDLLVTDKLGFSRRPSSFERTLISRTEWTHHPLQQDQDHEHRPTRKKPH